MGSTKPSRSQSPSLLLGSFCVASSKTIFEAMFISASACVRRLTFTIVESGPRIVAMMPAPRTPTIATAPNNVKNTLPRSDLRFLMDLIVIEPR